MHWQYYRVPFTESMMEKASSSHSSRGITLYMLCAEAADLRCGQFVHKNSTSADKSCWNAFSGFLWQYVEQPLMKVTFPCIISRFHPLSRQDYTFRDHFYSFQLERWVSKVFGLANHDEEFSYSLLSMKKAVNNDQGHMFAAIDDCPLLPSGVLRKGILSEWFSLHMSNMKPENTCAGASGWSFLV